MKKHRRIITRMAAGLGLLFLGSGAAWAGISTDPTVSSSSHSVNTSSTVSNITVSWSAAKSDISSSADITYEYLLDRTTTYSHTTFTSARASASSTRSGQLSNTLSVNFSSVTDGTYYFHMRAYDSSGLVSGSQVLNFGPLILDSKPALGSSPISPSSGDHSKAITVTITGSKFMSNATVKLTNGKRSTGSNPTTSLSDVTLTNVSVADGGNQITGTVPSGTIPGTYDLTVSNGVPNSQSVTSSGAYTSSNTAPTADAGSNQTPTLSSGTATFTLSGLASGTVQEDGSYQDTDGDTLGTYTWTLATAPDGATVTSSGASWAVSASKTGSTLSVLVNTSGVYTFTLVVDDGYENSSAVTTTVTVSAAAGSNNKPVANAGSDLLTAPKGTVTLTGSYTDADGDTVTEYVWILASKPDTSELVASADATPTSGTSAAVTQSGGTSQSSATFTPDVAGAYTIKLYVKDNDSGNSNKTPLWSDADSLTVTANSRPVAHAGEDQTVGQNVLATLDASASSDPESDTLTYTWGVSTGNSATVTLSSTSAQKPTFTPTVLGDYVFTLAVKDSAGNTSASSDSVTVVVSTPPDAPTAGSNQTLEMVADMTVSLAGTTADATAATYAWTVAVNEQGELQVPRGSSVTNSSLKDASGTATVGDDLLTGSFTPDKSGTYELSLTVSNSANVASAAATLTVTLNTRPVAHAGSAQTVAKDATVSLRGDGSSDVEGTSLTYAWVLQTPPDGVAAGDVVITQISSSNPSATFVPTVVGEYTFALTVSDGAYTSSNDKGNTVTVSVVSPPAAPLAGDNQVVGILVPGATVSLAGTTSDDSAASYAWAVVSVPEGSGVTSASLVDAGGAASSGDGVLTGSFEPDVGGTYELSLTVYDKDGLASLASTVSIVANAARPVAKPGEDRTVRTGVSTALSGSGSTDADKDSGLTYAWVSLSHPAGAADVEISQASSSSSTATFTPDVDGDYVFALTVHDGIYGSENADNTVVITASSDISFTLDVDGSGTVNATDGVLVLRRLNGGSTIATGVVLPDGRSNDDVVATIDQAGLILDVDGSGVVNATDGVLVLRRLNGGSTIDTGVVLPEGKNNDDVVAVIDALK